MTSITLYIMLSIGTTYAGYISYSPPMTLEACEKVKQIADNAMRSRAVNTCVPATGMVISK